MILGDSKAESAVCWCCGGGGGASKDKKLLKCLYEG